MFFLLLFRPLSTIQSCQVFFGASVGSICNDNITKATRFLFFFKPTCHVKILYMQNWPSGITFGNLVNRRTDLAPSLPPLKDVTNYSSVTQQLFCAFRLYSPSLVVNVKEVIVLFDFKSHTCVPPWVNVDLLIWS